jgi:4-alpha-glucanotransferase
MKVTFRIHYYTGGEGKICLTGSLPGLGAWDKDFVLAMRDEGDGSWSYELPVAGDTPAMEYGYFHRSGDGRQISEEWGRHSLVFDNRSSHYLLHDCWQVRPSNLPFYTSAFTQNLFARSPNPCSPAVGGDRKLVFKVSVPRVEKHQYVSVAGNCSVLGHWDPAKALVLSDEHFPEWQVTLDASDITFPLEYKFLIGDRDNPGDVVWETGGNRILTFPDLNGGDCAVVSGLLFRDGRADWRCAGTVIPVFSLRSEESFGIGDLGDLYKLIDWVKKTGQRVVQILPVNDTSATLSWRDSYPYNTISVYALHPVYISIPRLGGLKDAEKAGRYEEIRLRLNALDEVDYEAAFTHKLAYCFDYFLENLSVLETDSFRLFFAANESWLTPYAGFCYLRGVYGTADFTCWKTDAVYDAKRISRLAGESETAWREIHFRYFLQYVLHRQFLTVSEYARSRGVVLKGDLPIGVNRANVEVWTEPQYFNVQAQAGAPPDDFSATGQNWGFPTYNWEVMERDDFVWWKKRFRQMSDYFDCFRIDHILGFFRIWEIPQGYIQGLCGHFNPALPFSREEIESYGFPFDDACYTPRIHRRHLPALFGDASGDVSGIYLMPLSADYFTLKPVCDTQCKIESLFVDRDGSSDGVKAGLFAVANEVLFLRDPREPHKFHPRISAARSLAYQDLDESARRAFDRLYRDFFYHRHNDFWKKQAFLRLAPLMSSAGMLICGEDLGMIPHCVPEVMAQLQILSLEIERMPKEANREFTDLARIPYLSVCTTSTHDMTPIRNWWREDRAKTQRYYNNVLCRTGAAPDECTPGLAAQILDNHLASPSMLAIIPLQDWLAMGDENVRRPAIDSERINIPADPRHYWRYRMHLTMENLLLQDDFNEKIREQITRANRMA